MNNQTPWYYSWPVIIIAFFIFWPAGIALIILRNNANSNKQSLFLSTNKKLYIVLGVIMVLVGIATIGDSFLWGAFWLAGGIALVVYAGKVAKSAERRKKYIDLIVNQNITSMDKIASMCNVQYGVVEKEVRQLISFGVLKGASIDPATHMVTLQTFGAIAQGAGDVVQAISGSVQDGFVQESDEMITVVCSGCGAQAVVKKGSVVECEYCGGTIAVK